MDDDDDGDDGWGLLPKQAAETMKVKAKKGSDQEKGPKNDSAMAEGDVGKSKAGRGAKRKGKVQSMDAHEDIAAANLLANLGGMGKGDDGKSVKSKRSSLKGKDMADTEAKAGKRMRRHRAGDFIDDEPQYVSDYTDDEEERNEREDFIDDVERDQDYEESRPSTGKRKRPQRREKAGT